MRLSGTRTGGVTSFRGGGLAASVDASGPASSTAEADVTLTLCAAASGSRQGEAEGAEVAGRSGQESALAELDEETLFASGPADESCMATNTTSPPTSRPTAPAPRVALLTLAMASLYEKMREMPNGADGEVRLFSTR